MPLDLIQRVPVPAHGGLLPAACQQGVVQMQTVLQFGNFKHHIQIHVVNIFQFLKCLFNYVYFIYCLKCLFNYVYLKSFKIQFFPENLEFVTSLSREKNTGHWIYSVQSFISWILPRSLAYWSFLAECKKLCVFPGTSCQKEKTLNAKQFFERICIFSMFPPPPPGIFCLN